MTLQALRYIIEIAECKSFSSAARNLFMTQSALSSAVKEMEGELGVQIFKRTNRGVSLTAEGEDCLKYCKEIVERSDFLSARYQNRRTLPTAFSVSCQHLPFAVRAFNALLETLGPEAYDVAIRETETRHILHDVSSERSELGVVALQPEQLRLLEKSLFLHDLAFEELAQLQNYVFLRKRHPLAAHPVLTLEDLRNYPFVTYDQDQAPSYYSEETSSFEPFVHNIHVSDRATKMSIIRSTDAFSIGVDLPNFNRDIYFRRRNTELVALPLEGEREKIRVGCLKKIGRERSSIARSYLQLLRESIARLQPPSNA